MTKKVAARRNGKGDVYCVAVVPNPDGSYEQFTPAQMKSPAAHGLEVVEASAVAQNVLHESAPTNDGWVRVMPTKAGRFSPRPSASTSTRSRITEDDSQSLLAAQHSLTTRGFTQDGNNWTRGAVTVFVAADGSWRCGGDTGKDKGELESTLDSKYPQESFRQRLTEAFQSLGHSPREAEIASRANESVLLDAWTVIMGGNRDAARHARGHREVDHRIGILSDTRSR